MMQKEKAETLESGNNFYDKREQVTYQERIPTYIYEEADQASREVAAEIAELIRTRNEQGKSTVLGLATGSTPTNVYEELVRLHREEGLSFANVITFNLDEYYPMQPDSLQSYVRFMNEHLFDHIDIPEDQVHIPDGTVEEENIAEYCKQYEEKIVKAGGLDIQLLGIGRTGHIGFNEPGSRPDSRTRLITLDKITRRDAASDFFGEEHVPRRAITMGIGTIMNADKIVMMAWGEGKAPIIREAVEGPIKEQVPATYLQEHDNTAVILDEAAAAELTREKTPWVVGDCDWDDKLIRRAVVWLCQKVDKPILKLTDEDYNEHGMGELITQYGPAYNINLKVFNELQHTITGWPGGKPNADDTNRPERETPFPKRALIFSPHPDDDVISMGGTLIRLAEHGHEVHVAYQVSGNIAVFDDDVVRFADFVSDYQGLFGMNQAPAESMLEEIQEFIKNKEPGQVDSEEIQQIKGLIRRGEAKAAARYCGVPEDKLHFLDMPFYETGRVKKKPLSREDVDIVVELLRQVKPHQIYAAGDLSDPHGTHRVCLKAIFNALQECQDDAWIDDCYVWLYRGAWQEWDVNDIEMAVPLSPQELAKKRKAIFKHQSQKDRPLFPGADDREFWQRSEARNRNTAKLYDQLGLAEYEAIEAFVRYKL
ncbi:glucosamine-6-phosphate deaminase [Aliifodinibius sp. S!AR15-10]|uniref:glucosamine-6-phosphate deaminase n=1 Tax=Aliifodinibius sp. S!AR15-10 TaxID=2950437 RepID=UPI0028631275|nr:glucosamine-6-phosphate deaminase [Aliifodinibius sp. S!AR15-10]MDR8390779.1 glucosamine-6-phosphate deaminase [Aliifodinibius sp. S!AR15-10]